MLSYKGLKFPSPPKNRPYVIVEMVMTLDGKTRSGKYWPIGSQTDKRLMMELEQNADMVMQGAATVRIWHGKMRIEGEKPFATITASGTIGKLTRPTIIYALGRSKIKASGKYETKRFDAIREILNDMRKRGVKLLLVEGGAKLNWHLFKENIVDELFLTIAPKLVGGRDVKTIIEGRQFDIPRRAILVSVSQHDSEVFLRYTFSNSKIKNKNAK